MIAAITRLLRRWGLCEEVAPESRVDAATENIQRDIDHTLGELQDEANKFMEKSTELARQVEDRKSDIENILSHVRQAATSSATASELLSQMIDNRKRTNGNT